MHKVTLADWKATKEQIKAVNEVMKSGRLTYGPMTQKLEKDFARKHNFKYAIFTNSGTSSLQVSLHYLKEKYGWKDGDEVIVPAVTFVATVNVILQNNLKPVLVDVDPNYFEIDVNKIEDALTAKTRCIIPVDLLGQPCEIDKIKKIAKTYNLKIVEDSCETMFVKYKGQSVGSQADIACYSSYLAHIISTGVGGFICTNNEEAHNYMRSLIWHGRDNLYLNIDQNQKISPEKLIHARFKFDKAGYSYRLTELEAAIGIDEVRRSRQIIKKRNEIANYMFKKLNKYYPYIKLPLVRKQNEHAWMFFYIMVRPGVDRDKFALFLEKNGVQTRWVMPLTNQPVYKGIIKEKDYPVAKDINDNAFLLGSHQFMTKADVDYIDKLFGEYFK